MKISTRSSLSMFLKKYLKAHFVTQSADVQIFHRQKQKFTAF